MAWNVTQHNEITDTDIDSLISTINAYRRNQSSLSDDAVDGAKVDDALFQNAYSKISNINQDHCYCESDFDISHHFGGSPISLTSLASDHNAGDEIYASNLNELGADHYSLTLQCDCDSVSCNCDTNCTCESHCVCNTDCSCVSQCIQGGCGCNTDGKCTCNADICPCDGVCAANIPIYCTCNYDCSCNDQCNCEYGG